MAYEFDYENKYINVTQEESSVDMQTLYNAIKEEELTNDGIKYPNICGGSGKEDLGNDVYVGITIELLGDWQLKFEEGNYIAKVTGGNLVKVGGGDPVAYTAGVQVLLIQSASSTVVQISSGTSLSTEEHNKLLSLPDAETIANTVLDEEV